VLQPLLLGRVTIARGPERRVSARSSLVRLGGRARSRRASGMPRPVTAGPPPRPCRPGRGLCWCGAGATAWRP